MAYNDFIDYITNYFDTEETYESPENIITYGISWCNEGEDEDTGEPTKLCAYCKYYKDCDALLGSLESNSIDN